VLLKCSPKSQANTRCFNMPLDCNWFLAGRVLKNDRSSVISLPCLRRTIIKEKKNQLKKFKKIHGKLKF
jgi:hypothetical protein